MERDRFREAIRRELAALGITYVGTNFGRGEDGFFHEVTATVDDVVTTERVEVPEDMSPWSLRLVMTVVAAFKPLAPSCCDAMRTHLGIRCCDAHGEASPDKVILRSAFPLGEGRWLLVGELAAYDFEFCPWCGKQVQGADNAVPGTRRLYAPCQEEG